MAFLVSASWWNTNGWEFAWAAFVPVLPLPTTVAKAPLPPTYIHVLSTSRRLRPQPTAPRKLLFDLWASDPLLDIIPRRRAAEHSRPHHRVLAVCLKRGDSELSPLPLAFSSSLSLSSAVPVYPVGAYYAATWKSKSLSSPRLHSKKASGSRQHLALAARPSPVHLLSPASRWSNRRDAIRTSGHRSQRESV